MGFVRGDVITTRLTTRLFSDGETSTQSRTIRSLSYPQLTFIGENFLNLLQIDFGDQVIVLRGDQFVSMRSNMNDDPHQDDNYSPFY